LVGVQWLFHADDFTPFNNAGTHSVGDPVNSWAGVDGSGEGKNVLPSASIESQPNQAVAVKAKALFLGKDQYCLLSEGVICNCTP
jgi:hypothetical protein